MENLLDLANQDETQPVEAATATPETVETKATEAPAELASEVSPLRRPSRKSTRRPKLQWRKHSRRRL
jgi:hypothetical protein